MAFTPATAKGEKKGERKGGDKKRDLWGVTLGETQYRWLAKTLTESRARWKFVFCHHALGAGRGGIELAGLAEWGGKDRRGVSSFTEKRPGWPAPIHDLMAKNHVTILFHGHDHFYAKQECDGIIYQEVPQPGTPSPSQPRTAAEYGYRSGVILGSPGHLRVQVSPSGTTIEYVRAALPENESSNRRNGDIAHSYTIPVDQR